MMKKYILAAFAAFASVGALAQETGTVEISPAASVVFPFSRVDRNPSSLAMGGTSLIENAASICFQDKFVDGAVSYTRWQPKVQKSNDINADVLFNIKNTVGINIGCLSSMRGEYDISPSMGIHTGSFSPSDLEIFGGVGYCFLKKFGVSVGAHYYSSKLTNAYTLSGIGIDALFNAKFGDFVIAAGVTQIGPKAKSSSSSASYSLPSAASVAAQWKKTLAPDQTLDLRAEGEYYFCGKARGAVGAEYSYKFVSARMGFNAGGLTGSFFSAGLGFNFKGVSADLAYVIAGGGVGNSVSAGLGFKF